MQKKNIIISLIVSFIFLFYMIFDYLGYVRYLKLHLYSMSSYIENYTKLDKADKTRVVVSFKYNKENVKDLKPFINSILDSSVRVDDISICTPYKNIKNIPEEMKKVLSIVGTSLDKIDNDIHYSILKEPESNTKIIIVNPDMIYGKDFIQTIVDESNSNPDKIICDKNENALLIKPEFFCSKNEKLSQKENFSIQKWVENCDRQKMKLKYNENFKRLR